MVGGRLIYDGLTHACIWNCAVSAKKRVKIRARCMISCSTAQLKHGYDASYGRIASTKLETPRLRICTSTDGRREGGREEGGREVKT